MKTVTVSSLRVKEYMCSREAYPIVFVEFASLVFPDTVCPHVILGRLAVGAAVGGALAVGTPVGARVGAFVHDVVTE